MYGLISVLGRLLLPSEARLAKLEERLYELRSVTIDALKYTVGLLDGRTFLDRKILKCMARLKNN